MTLIKQFFPMQILPSQPYGALTEVKPKDEAKKVEVETVEYDE